MKRLSMARSAKNERGQTLPLFALLLVVLILFVGLAIDFGFAYVTRANLSKAVDAAALAGARSIAPQGDTAAKAIATNAFNMNYGAPGRDSGAPTLTLNVVPDDIADPTCPPESKCLNVDATATINTFFIKILPQWTTLKVSAHAQGKRGPVIMSLVLDRSGSMNLNGGAGALPGAVSDFIAKFDDTLDRVSMVSFATGHSVDVSVTRPFIQTVQKKVNAGSFDGGTFTVGGLQDAITQNASITDTNALKVVVFFTDGWANMNQDQLTCLAGTQLIYGGCSPPEQAVGWCGGTVSFYKVTDAAKNINTPNAYNGCSSSTKFPSAQNGGTLTAINMTNVSNDAIYRAEQMANTLRSQGTAVYAVGLGDYIKAGFLEDLANIPTASTFNSNQPQGAVVLAPTAADLDQAFQMVANQILTRLTR